MHLSVLVPAFTFRYDFMSLSRFPAATALDFSFVEETIAFLKRLIALQAIAVSFLSADSSGKISGSRPKLNDGR